SSYSTPSSSPVAFLIARSITSLDMFDDNALSTAARRRGLLFGSPPPARAATPISRISLVKILPRLASLAFLRASIEGPRPMAYRSYCVAKRRIIAGRHHPQRCRPTSARTRRCAGRPPPAAQPRPTAPRSEERRGGKEGGVR